MDLQKYNDFNNLTYPFEASCLQPLQGMRASLRLLLILSVLCFLLLAGTEDAFARTAAPYPGYVSDVEGEKAERYVEVYLYAPTYEREKTLHELIFSPLTGEFQSRYQEKFGKLDPDSILYQNSFRESKDNRGNSEEIEKMNEERRAFAEYMTRRLTEYHFDHYMNTKPEFRPIMEVKEQIQNVKVEVTKDTRLNIQYNFAANIIDLVMDNPYCDAKLALEMDPKAFGPGRINETRLHLAKNLTSSISASADVRNSEGLMLADLGKSFSKYHLGTSMGVTAKFKEGTAEGETIYRVGFSHSY